MYNQSTKPAYQEREGFCNKASILTPQDRPNQGELGGLRKNILELKKKFMGSENDIQQNKKSKW